MSKVCPTLVFLLLLCLFFCCDVLCDSCRNVAGVIGYARVTNVFRGGKYFRCALELAKSEREGVSFVVFWLSLVSRGGGIF